MAFSWFSFYKLLANPNKTHQLILGLSQETQPQLVKLSGMYIDSQLNWHDHINYISTTLSRVSFLIWKLGGFVTDDFLLTSYFNLFSLSKSYWLWFS